MPPALRMSQHHISRYMSQPTQTEFWIVKFRFKRLYQNYIRLYMLIIVYIIVYICLFYSLRTSNILGAHTPSHTRTPYEESSLLSSAKSHGRGSTHRRSRLKQGQGLGCFGQLLGGLWLETNAADDFHHYSGQCDNALVVSVTTPWWYVTLTTSSSKQFSG